MAKIGYNPATQGEPMATTDELLDDLMKNYKKPEDLVGENGLLKQLTKRLLERAMAAEMTEHVGYEKHDAAGNKSGNSRNGNSAKTLKGSFGTMPIEVPRDRNGTFEPQIIEKHQTRFTGFDANIISLYARGLSTREIQQHLEEIYHVEVSPALISTVTDAVLEEVKTWQNRQLDAVYPIMYLDAIQFKVRDSGHVRNKAIYLAIGITLSGMKEVLGLWIAQTEGAKFWLQVVTELKNRGVNDILIACVDGLKGFPEAIESVNTGDQDVVYAPVLQLRHHLQPELRAFRLRDPQAQHFLHSAQRDANSQVNRFVPHMPAVSHFELDGVQIHDWVDRVELPVLPRLHLLQHRISYCRNQSRRYFNVIDLFQVLLDLPR